MDLPADAVRIDDAQAEIAWEAGNKAASEEALVAQALAERTARAKAERMKIRPVTP